jgi:polyhydroxybutyrate depolymerase
MLAMSPSLKLRSQPSLSLAACVVLLFSVASLSSQDAPAKDAPGKNSPAKDSQEKVDVDDISRSYVVHVPPGYDQQQHYPVVILLHGQNQDANEMARLTHFNQLADKDSVIAVYPNALHGEWNIGVRPEAVSEGMPQRRRGYGRGGWPGGGGGYPGGGGGYPGGGQGGGDNPDQNRNRSQPADDVAFLNQVLDQVALKYSVDTRRIYATGLSDGGFMALRAGCNMADRVAAIAAVGASMPKTMICLPSRAVPALFIHGTDDPRRSR